MAAGSQALTETSATILAANGSRNGVVLFNEGTNTAYISFEGTAVKNEGITIQADSGIVLDTARYGSKTIRQAITGVCAAGETATLTYHETE